MKKSELAKIQIEKAIDLFCIEKDYASAITLAGAAEEMLGNILRSKNKDGILAELHPWFEDRYDKNIKFAELAKGANEVRDELKHGHENPDPDFDVNVSVSICAQMIMRALVNYPRVVGSPTEKMKQCHRWIQENYESIFSDWNERNK